MLRSPRRRVVGIASALVLFVTTIPVANAGTARQAAAPPGAGQGIAELVQIDPAIANLALTIRIGTSLAGHQNLGATSEARSVDLGFIGSILTGEPCDGGNPTIPPEAIPEIIAANSADPADADGVSDDLADLISVFARADTTPASSATATLEPLGLPGLVEVVGGQTSVQSTADGHRTVAVSEIGQLDIADGLVSIRGMRWEAVRQLEPSERSATFEAGSLFIAGAEVPLPTADVLSTIQQAVAPVLGPLGVELSFPEVVDIPDGIALTPLSVGIVPGELRDGILGPILGGLQPTRSSLSDFLIEADCGNSTYVTVLDVILGAMSGAGFTAVRLGGVQADARSIELSSFLGGSTDPAPAPPSLSDPSVGVPTIDASSGSPATPTVTTTPASPTTTAAVQPVSDEVAIGPITVPGSRGGALLGIGLLGFLLAAFAAGRDRHLMRKAQRSMPMDGDVS